MKKIYTLVAALGFVGSLFAQNTGNQSTYSPSIASKKTGPSLQKGRSVPYLNPNFNSSSNESVNGVQKAVLYTSNFSNSGEWSVLTGSDGSPYDGWVIGTTTPLTTSWGNCLRPTGGAGAWACLRVAHATIVDPFSATLVSTASFSTIGQYAIQIKFRQYYRTFTDVTKIVVSTDNGANWQEVSIPSNDVLATNASFNTAAATFNTVDISSVAGNSANVRVGFRMTGNQSAYWWGIDDVTVETRPPSNELTMNSFYNIEYTKVPYDYAFTPEFVVRYSNVGGSVQNNVNVVTKLNSSIYKQTEVIPTFNPGETQVLTYTPTTTEIPVLGIGTYSASTTIFADEVELTPANNTLSNNFEITTNKYSRDNNILATGDEIPFSAGETHMASSFFVFGDVTINSAEFVVGTGTTANSVVRVQVYQIPTGGSGWNQEMASLTPIGSAVTYTITAGNIPSVGANPTSITVPLTGATLSAPTGAYVLVSVERISGTVSIPYDINERLGPENFYSNIAGWFYDPTNGTPAGSDPAWFFYGDHPSYFIRMNTQSSCVELTGHNTSSTPATCAALDGSVNVTNPTNGFGPYEFIWYTNPMSTNANTTGLAAGTYDVLMVDVSTLTNSGCPTQATATVAFNNTPVTYTKTVTQPTCLLPNGAIDISGATGNGPHTYAWTPTTAGNTASVSGLAPGSYTLNITDNDGCFSAADLSVLVNAGVPSTFTLSQTATSNCSTSDGTATVASTTGPALSSYAWSTAPVQTDVTATGLAGGTNYTLTAINTDNCTSSKSIIVNAGGAPTASTTLVSSVSCFAGNNGAFNVVLVPATPNYTYTVNGGASTTSSSISGLTAGTYTVTGTDGSCNISTSSVIKEPATAISGGNATITNINCNGAATGSIVVSAVTGGTGAYKYSWTGTTTGGPQTSTTIGSLGAGTYNVVVKDANNCTLTPALAAATLTEPTAIVFTATPVTSTTAVKKVTITISGGTPPYTLTALSGTVSAINPAAGTSSITLSVAGDNTLTLTDSKGCAQVVNVVGVGIEKTDFINNLSVFPNPTENNVTISFNSIEAKNVTVKLISLNGQEIFNQELPQFVGEYSKTVNLSTQAQGVYFLQIVSDKNVTTKKVVKL